MTKDTCPKDEYLEIDKNIQNLADEILSKSELEIGNQISEGLVSSKKKKEWARTQLRVIVGMKPKRPLFYANLDLQYLPQRTRNPVRDLGDYIDHLVKFWTSEILKNNKYLKESLGKNLYRLSGKIDEDLRLKLNKYNDFCYVPAKHDFEVKNRVHRITSKEAVFIALLTMKFAKIIKDESPLAKAYAEETIEDDWAEMRYSNIINKGTIF